MDVIIDKDNTEKKKYSNEGGFEKSRNFIKAGGSEPGAVHTNKSKDNNPINVHHEHRNKHFGHGNNLKPSRLNPDIKKEYPCKVDGEKIEKKN